MEIAVISPDTSIDLKRVQVHSEDKIALSPGMSLNKVLWFKCKDPWPHWTIKEIMEQPIALALSVYFFTFQLVMCKA